MVYYYCQEIISILGYRRCCTCEVTYKQEGVFSLLEKYNRNKEMNQQIGAYMMKNLSEQMQLRFSDCGSFIEMLVDKEEKNGKSINANFCNNRFCPLCSWRRARKDALKIDVIMKYVKLEQDKQYIFLTLTAPNVKAENLKGEIDRYNLAFKKLMSGEKVRRMNRGYIRKLEITYNEKRNDYHPHFHILIAVEDWYFTDRTYISQEHWLKLWREAMSDWDIKIVFVNRVYDMKNGVKDEFGKKNGTAVQELAKYAAKDTDYQYSEMVFDMFYKALKGRQIITYNGLFKDAVKLYKDGMLDKYINEDTIEYYWRLFFRWGGHAYGEIKRFELTEDMKREIMGKKVMEVDVD